MNFTSKPSKKLMGIVTCPRDKSISHRSVIMAASATGKTKIYGLLNGEDVKKTIYALREMGVPIRLETNQYGMNAEIFGSGIGGLKQPGKILDMGNSGTATRLLMGLVATHSFNSTFSGDRSLLRRPMDRVANPLEKVGATIKMHQEKFLPLTIYGSNDPLPIKYKMPVPSAQIKSAILFAGLNTPGLTTVIEPIPSRDHTEKLMKLFGAKIQVIKNNKIGKKVTLEGHNELLGKDVFIPGDPSSAAFITVAALINPGSKIKIKNVNINPLRTGLYKVLKRMGGNIKFTNPQKISNEAVADLVVHSSNLKGINLSEKIAPTMIDEYPILSIAAAFAKGKTILNGLKELRLKESDRIQSIVNGLKKCGVEAEEKKDKIIIYGNNNPEGGSRINSNLDHRIAMSFLIFGTAAKEPIQVTDAQKIGTSFPNFLKTMNQLGAKIIR